MNKSFMDVFKEMNDNTGVLKFWYITEGGSVKTSTKLYADENEINDRIEIIKTKGKSWDKEIVGYEKYTREQYLDIFERGDKYGNI